MGNEELRDKGDECLIAIKKWADYVKSKKLEKKKEKFIIGHPWMFREEFDKVTSN